jgi:hypothetical protein
MRSGGEKEVRPEEGRQTRQALELARETALMSRTLTRPAVRVLLGFAASALATAVVGVAPAIAGPYWRLSSSPAPANLPPGGEGKIVVGASNLGDTTISPQNEAIVISDKLPPHVVVTGVLGELASEQGALLECTHTSADVTCSDKEKVLPPNSSIKLTINVKVEEPPGTVATLTNEVKASGGETPAAATSQPVKISPASAPFGVEKYDLRAEEEGGAPDVRAGSHPFQLTTTIAFNQNAKEEPVDLPRNLEFNLPPGLLGNPTIIPQCSQGDFNTVLPGPRNLCKTDTVVGVAEVTVDEPLSFPSASTVQVPVFNLEPAPGEPARFGILPVKVPVVLDTAVRTGSDYGVVVTARDTSQTAGLVSSRLVIWGVPGDPRHNLSRGYACVGIHSVSPETAARCKAQQEAEALAQKQEKEEGKEPKPFLSLPTSCGTPMRSPMRAQSWVAHAEFLPPVESEFTESLEGCGLLPFEPILGSREFKPGVREPGIEPQSKFGSTTSGLNVRVSVPQPETATGLAESAVRSTTVTLPQGLQLNPAAAGGLLACSALQMGFVGGEEATQTNNDQFSPDPANCPPQSKVGTVAIKSPDLKNELKGDVYLAAQNTNPFEPPLILYLVASDPVSGVVVKLAGKTAPTEGTGQLVSTFENTPQVPFEELTLHFFGSEEGGSGRASVSTPPLCGSYATASSFVPWSGNAPATPSATFDITSGPGGGPCSPNPLPFAPPFDAGITNHQAGGFTGFTLTIGRPDGQQALTGLSTHLPQGLAALISSVNPCPIERADAAQCGSDSLVGHSTSVTGLGSEPYSLAGRVYLTGGYRGAPFGLSVATPALAGPFNLGTVIANSTIEIDPNTAAVTVTTRETRILDARGGTTIAGSALPTMIKGVPVQLKAINVQIDRPNFQFNPTSCDPMAITGSLTGDQGGSEPVSSPFQVANCGSLPFEPKLAASVDGKGSKPTGVGFYVKLESAGLGQANIHKVELQLPIALPSRLSTIQQACPDNVFEANPAACGEGSNIGRAVIHTPVLRSPLEGPAYLVSHANLAFPDVVFVLQGEGIKLVLDGHTDIKKGITYSRFEAAPDAPFTTFETSLPAGPHSALGVNVAPSKNYSLCGAALAMPTKIVGQNGAEIDKVTQINPAGCVAVKGYKATRAQLLAKALKACRKKKNKHRRVACERAARKKYGPPAKHKKSSTKKKK